MKSTWKRVCAVAASAAMAIAGLAAGVTSANAAAPGKVNDKATFTFQAESKSQLESLNLTAYKIADYIKYTNGEDSHYGVQTPAAIKSVVTEALNAATSD